MILVFIQCSYRHVWQNNHMWRHGWHHRRLSKHKRRRVPRTDSPSHDWVNDSLSIYKAVPLALDLIKLFLKQFKDALEWRKINLRTTEPNSIVKELKKEPKRDKIAEGDSNYQFQQLWKKFQNELIDLRLQRSPNRSQEIIISTGSKIQNVQFTKIFQNIFNIL